MSIPYPVPEGTKCRTYDPKTQEFVGKTKPWPRRDGMEVTPKDGTILLILTKAEPPSYDSSTEKVVGNYVIDGNEYRLEYTITPLTRDELDAVAEREADEQEKDMLKNAYQTFKDGNATNAQVQRAIAWLIKQYA